VVFKDSGEPDISISIGSAEHNRLVSIVGELDCPLLSRLRDYYKDVEYVSTEIDALGRELDSIRDRVTNDGGLLSLLSEVRSLLTVAKSAGRSVVAIAD
jgi:hypothetical protein